jgi:hypothetical protein
MLDRRSAIRQDDANGCNENCSECSILAALAKATAFPPWLTFHNRDDARAIGGKLMALFLF